MVHGEQEQMRGLTQPDQGRRRSRSEARSKTPRLFLYRCWTFCLQLNEAARHLLVKARTVRNPSTVSRNVDHWLLSRMESLSEHSCRWVISTRLFQRLICKVPFSRTASGIVRG